MVPLIVYPKPTDGQFFLDQEPANPVVELEIFDSFGCGIAPTVHVYKFL